MVILGLGSNLGDRLANLHNALTAIQRLSTIQIKQVSPIYISEALLPENAPADWDKPYLNLALRCETNLEPLELLAQLKNIEWSIGRKPEVRHWGPRIVDIDILAWDEKVITSEELTVPHASLQERPFALWPLADVAPLWTFPLSGTNYNKTAAEIVEQWGSRFNSEAPFKTRQLQQRIDTPELVGILNITPDSFSDGGKFINCEQAVNQAIHLVNSGATILDIGAESTAPHAAPVSADTEWSRLQPVLNAIITAKNKFILPVKISIDTRHASVAEQALTLGVDWINDVSGLDDPAMRNLLAQSTADCVIMHHVSIPASRQHILPRNQNPVSSVYEWGARRLDELEKNGITRDRIIFDPGIGFGKTPEQSLELVKHADIFKKLGTRLLIGHSRKLFLTLFTAHPANERDIETLAISLALANKPIDYLRVHQVDMCARGIKVLQAL